MFVDAVRTKTERATAETARANRRARSHGRIRGRRPARARCDCHPFTEWRSRPPTGRTLGAGQAAKQRQVLAPRELLAEARARRQGAPPAAGSAAAPAGYRPCQWRRRAAGGRIGCMATFPALKRATQLSSAVLDRPKRASAPRVRSNPSLKRRPSTAGRLARQAGGQCRPVGPSVRPLRAP